MPQYSIYIEPETYTVALNDIDGKIVENKDENSVVFRKTLNGTFSFNRSAHIKCFDRLMAMTFCENGVITVTDRSGEIAQGIFMKKDLTISEFKCLIEIKFDRYDEYTGLDSVMDKEINVLALNIPVKTVISINLPLIETFRHTSNLQSDSVWTADYGGGFRWIGDTSLKPIIPWGAKVAPSESMWSGWNVGWEEKQWTFQQNYYKYIEGYHPNNIFSITSFYERQVIYVPRLGDVQSATPSNTGLTCDKFAWQFDYYNPLTKQDKFARKTEISLFVENPDFPSGDKYSVIMYTGFRQSGCYSETIRYTRCRKLNDIIKAFISPYFVDFESEFFKNTVNPISGKDLTNILLSQKSDSIGTTSDPATKGILTLQRLLALLTSMFNVRWAVDKFGKFRIEHIKYWDNNGTYGTPPETESVGINLVVEYPVALIGSNEYSFEDKLPIREKFTFMESWRLDFIGMDIDYSDCIKVGDSITHSASEVTTDIDPALLSGYASKDGFAMFHCDSVANGDGSFNVLTETGKISGLDIENAHLSWANLHNAYWKYDRFLPQGKMNGVVTDFDIRPLKYQKPISFPYCFSMFDPQKLIKTNLGNGIVKAATLSFKTNFITVELAYKDNI